MHPRHLFIAIIMGVITMGTASAYAKGMSAQDFVRKASIANEFEIESSNLALEKSKNSKVKSFAQHMVDDHTQTGDKLKEALESSKSNAEPAESLDEKHQNLLNQLDGASGQDFDSQYISMQTKAHKEAVSLFSDYSKHGKDPALKDFAAETLPALKDHLKHVTKLNK
jgi:putative membrane protein